MRVIAGQYRRRTLRSLPGLEIRPTSDRLRETLFNVLCSGNPEALAESTWIDLYAGTGAVGIEALSRGAQMVFFVESSKAAADLIAANLKSLGIAHGIPDREGRGRESRGAIGSGWERCRFRISRSAILHAGRVRKDAGRSGGIKIVARAERGDRRAREKVRSRRGVWGIAALSEAGAGRRRAELLSAAVSASHGSSPVPFANSSRRARLRLSKSVVVIITTHG